MTEKKVVLISRHDSLVSEDHRLRNWFQNLGIFLNTHPSDNEFRGKLSKDNPDSLWNARPLILKKLDYVPQFWFHTENVGFHTYHVAMNLDTEKTYNGVDYLKKRPNMIKVIRAAALFHDNGKRNDPANHNHPYDSAQEVEQYLKWMDFNDKEVQLCLHLIANHDILGKSVNPHTKKTVEDITKICQTPAILQCFWILTIADIKSIEGLIKIPNILENITEVVQIAYHRFKKMEEKKLYSLPGKTY